jgi:cytoskeletal protein CcmA (bactofilin family)
MGWLCKRQSPAIEAKAENVFAAGTSVKGNVRAKGSVRIEGEVEGDLATDGNIVVGKGAEVRAKLSGRCVVVSGIVHGDIRADGRLEILASGRVWGDVQVGSLEIAEGGLLRGVCEMLVEGEDAGATQAKRKVAAAEPGDSSAKRQ